MKSKNYLIGGLLLVFLLSSLIAVLFVRQSRLKQNQKAYLLEQKALRAQINPHFFSNALNSIQKLIPGGGKNNAHEYIAKFSSLMRAILDNSDKTFVPIEDELAAVKLYLDMERLRVDNEFDYTINIDPGLDIHEITMPAMLLQPYAENAIWHGLIGKKNNGQVIISVMPDADEKNIIFTISDNGIGRNISSKEQVQERFERPSGMKLVKDRVDAVNAMKKKKMNVEIIDLLTDEGLPAGTKVMITMSLNS